MTKNTDPDELEMKIEDFTCKEAMAAAACLAALMRKLQEKGCLTTVDVAEVFIKAGEIVGEAKTLN
jgi:hypothetical protein